MTGGSESLSSKGTKTGRGGDLSQKRKCFLEGLGGRELGLTIIQCLREK